MSNIELRFLFLLSGFPTIAASKEFSNYDRKIAEQIVAYLGWLPDDEDRELDDVLGDDMIKEDARYGQEWGT